MDANFESLRIKDEYLARVLAGEAYLVMDGAMGTMIQRAGLDSCAELPDLLNLSHPQEVTAIHRAYVEAGSQVVVTNTFGANALKLKGRASVAEVFAAAAENVRAAGARYVGADIGPTGALLEPLGSLSFEEAYDLFVEQVEAAVAADCDLIVIETMSDLREAKAAVLAAREHSNLPVFVTMTFGEDGRTFLGTTPGIAASTLSSLGVQAVGVNCSLGPDELASVVEEVARFARCPIMAQPNAGLPRIVDGRTVYDVDPADFARSMQPILEAGAVVVGGCCGTDPSFISALCATIEGKTPVQPAYERGFCVTSAQEMVMLPQGAQRIAVIGERINPTGKKRLQAALREGNYDYVIGEAVSQIEAGADILDVNVGVPGLDEPKVLAEVIERLLGTVTTPLQIDSSDPNSVEAAARKYPGRPLVNSVNGKQSSLDAVLPIVKRYGCTVVGLTLDEDGIPPTAEARFAIAERIVREAEALGIPRDDIAIDCLVMAAATNQAEVAEILRAVTMVKERLGVRTVLGVSNVSFGMPQRMLLNATFLAAAFGAGLDMPILNPMAPRYRDAVAAFRVLNGQDEGTVKYVENYAQAVDPYDGKAAAGAAAAPAASPRAAEAIPAPAVFEAHASLAQDLAAYVLAGRAAPAATVTEELLAVPYDGLQIVNEILVPALDVVGAKYDKGEFFLPQLMASAEAAKAGFDMIRDRMAAADGQAASLGEERVIVVATVEGDIHDIGKNIVRMLLENYGFKVIDLGRDVAPQLVVDALREHGATLAGLSALMTTTVGAMERTIKLIHEEILGCKVMVGGAVLTADYAQQIQADYYAKDAAEAARVATAHFEALGAEA